jgi:hypothetical protein
MQLVKKPFKLFIIAIVVVLVLIPMWSCYYDSQEFLFPQLPNDSIVCDSAKNVTYSVTIDSIMTKHCYSCHSNASAGQMGAGIVLQGYSNLKARVSDKSLMDAITQNGKVIPMPLGGAKLDDCTISYIKKWINAGSPNN